MSSLHSDPVKAFPAEEKEVPFNLEECIKLVRDENPEDIKEIQKCEGEIRDYRKRIALEAKKNFELEHALNHIDEKIKLLISNRMKVEEVLATAHHLKQDKKRDDGGETSPIRGKVHLYEDLFYLLQTRPAYFAQLARLVQSKEAPQFVKTVVFDMYGDQYDSREERLLLLLFQRAIHDEIQNTTNKGSLFRANTATTQMLSSYARRGSGLAILKQLLQDPLINLTKQPKNLDIAPRNVYQQVIDDYETKTGERSALPRQVDDVIAAKDPDVVKIIETRGKELVEETDIFLQRILGGVEKIPFGMRWICKQLGVMSKDKFPDADKFQIGSLIGGNIFLRFFCPAIVTPDAYNFISTKPTKVQRKNLILIVKVLQGLSNGIPFGSKEQHLIQLNPYLERNKHNIQTYFENLVEVDDPEDSLQLVVDKYLEHTSGNVLHLSLNQIFLVHRLIETHIDILAPLTKTTTSTDAHHKDDMFLRELLRQLGEAPGQLKQSEDREVLLSIMERRVKRNSTNGAATAEMLANAESSPMRAAAEQLKASLIDVLSKVDAEGSECNDVMAFLAEQQQAAFSEGKEALAQQLAQVQKMFKILYSKNEMDIKGTEEATYNNFVSEVAKEVASRQNIKEHLKKRLKMVTTAMNTITKFHGYLGSRLELYNIYLENVRKGRGDVHEKEGKKKKKKKKKDKNKLKLSHPELVERRIVTWTNSDLEKNFAKTLKKLYYNFSEVSPGKYQVDITVKKGLEIKIPGFGKPIELMLEQLLKMQENGERELSHENLVKLNVNLLINLLNTQFVAKEAARISKNVK